MHATSHHRLQRFLRDYAMLFVLLVLCAVLSLATLKVHSPEGEEAAEEISDTIHKMPAAPRSVLLLAGEGEKERTFVGTLRERLSAGTSIDITSLSDGSPVILRRTLELRCQVEEIPDLIVASSQVASWPMMQSRDTFAPCLAKTPMLMPEGTMWPDFLRAGNLKAIADRIVVIAIMAIGMTMVIITGGIDLSVGSLLALAAVLATWLIEHLGGAMAPAWVMVLSMLAAIAACGVVGAFSGAMVSSFSIPPFIVTLAMMLIASGIAFLIAGGQSIYDLPEGMSWLGRGASMGLPHTLLLMLLLYTAAHILMSRTVLGRYLYAVGGNREAARLSGVPVKRVVLFAYACSGLLAGLGGVVQASQLRSGAPTYGLMYELYVIAAVVVGGTSLSGGEGKILGTLIGVFLIAVIQNGMNLLGVESYTQKVVLGGVILGAVLLERLRKRRLA